jgi:hypothetical protein
MSPTKQERPTPRRHLWTGRSPRKVWNFLTGDVIADQRFWEEYQSHVKRRNEAAHNTAPHLTTADAEASLAAATAFVDHIEQITGTILGSNSW